MLEQLKNISWPHAAVLVALIAGGVSASILAPEDVRAGIVAVLMAIAGIMRSPSHGAS